VGPAIDTRASAIGAGPAVDVTTRPRMMPVPADGAVALGCV